VQKGKKTSVSTAVVFQTKKKRGKSAFPLKVHWAGADGCWDT